MWQMTAASLKRDIRKSMEHEFADDGTYHEGVYR